MNLKQLLKENLFPIYQRFFLKYSSPVFIEKMLRNSTSILDLGCGKASPVGHFSNNRFCVGIDAFESSIEESKKQKIHDKYYKMDVLDIDKEFAPDSFDSVIALDLIEHLTKEKGKILIEKMEAVARKNIIIYTPNGFIPQAQYEENYYQIHRSGWTVNEMREKGFTVMGINGWKPLRGELSFVKYRPKLFWRLISDLSEFAVVNKPSKAFQLLCFKAKKRNKTSQ